MKTLDIHHPAQVAIGKLVRCCGQQSRVCSPNPQWGGDLRPEPAIGSSYILAVMVSPAPFPAASLPLSLDLTDNMCGRKGSGQCKLMREEIPLSIPKAISVSQEFASVMNNECGRPLVSRSDQCSKAVGFILSDAWPCVNESLRTLCVPYESTEIDRTIAASSAVERFDLIRFRVGGFALARRSHSLCSMLASQHQA